MTTRHFVICEPWSVVVVPFPFSDRPGTKRRPALVLSKRAFNIEGNSVLGMITSAKHTPWPGDTEIREYAAAGLNQNCTLRLKLFTLDNRLILKQIGRLSRTDRQRADDHLKRFLV